MSTQSGARGAAATLIALAAIAALLTPAATAKPQGGKARSAPMLGVVSQTELVAGRDVRRMRTAGVDSLRFLVPWSRVEPGPGVTNWSLIDQRFLAATQARAVPLATVYGSPARFGPPSTPPTSSPAEMDAWLAFLRKLVLRYGPGGSFVQEHPGARPIKRWQIWNEPNLTAFWGGLEPSPGDYVELLDRSAATIRELQPRAKVITAGLSPAARGLGPGRFLAGMYERWKRLGTRPSFDELALHPYADSIGATERLIRQAMRVSRRAGHPRPWTTIAEVAWGSGGPPGYPLAGTPRTQVRLLEAAYEMFAERARAWNISSVYWFAMRDLERDVEGCGFCEFTGLIDHRGRAKPAWGAFKRVLRRAGRARR